MQFLPYFVGCSGLICMTTLSCKEQCNRSPHLLPASLSNGRSALVSCLALRSSRNMDQSDSYLHSVYRILVPSNQPPPSMGPHCDTWHINRRRHGRRLSVLPWKKKLSHVAHRRLSGRRSGRRRYGEVLRPARRGSRRRSRRNGQVLLPVLPLLEAKAGQKPGAHGESNAEGASLVCLRNCRVQEVSGELVGCSSARGRVLSLLVVALQHDSTAPQARVKVRNEPDDVLSYNAVCLEPQ